MVNQCEGFLLGLCDGEVVESTLGLGKAHRFSVAGLGVGWLGRTPLGLGKAQRFWLRGLGDEEVGWNPPLGLGKAHRFCCGPR